MTDGTSGQNVRRRKVFYLPGYDPFPPRRYRELYRREGAAQAAVSGYTLAVRGAPGTAGWSVQGRMAEHDVETHMEVLIWSDLVQASMSGSALGTYVDLLRTAWIYLSTGTLWRLTRLRKGPVIAALYPVVVLLLQFAVAVAVGWGAVRGLGAENLLLVLAIWISVGFAVLWAFHKADRWLFAHYLMRDYAYSAREGGAYPPELQARLEQFAEQIAEAVASPVDEVLVVGHSSGAYLGVSVLGQLLRTDRIGTGAPVAFLSLGQVVPMVSALPGAGALRGDLALLGHQDQIFWLDVTAPGDGCAFALCDPVAVSGVARADQTGPLVISARFTKTLAPETWARLRWRFFRLHFQYLCAFDRPGDYDYFAITAGPATLASRYADRAPSPSVVRRNVAP